MKKPFTETNWVICSHREGALYLTWKIKQVLTINALASHFYIISLESRKQLIIEITSYWEKNQDCLDLVEISRLQPLGWILNYFWLFFFCNPLFFLLIKLCNTELENWSDRKIGCVGNLVMAYSQGVQNRYTL